MADWAWKETKDFDGQKYIKRASEVAKGLHGVGKKLEEMEIGID